MQDTGLVGWKGVSTGKSSLDSKETRLVLVFETLSDAKLLIAVYIILKIFPFDLFFHDETTVFPRPWHQNKNRFLQITGSPSSNSNGSENPNNILKIGHV